MPLIEWKESFSVKIASIDTQHKVLVEMINEFYEEINKKSNNDLISSLIKKMKEYIVFHFSYEEDILKQNNWPHYQEHKNEHSRFIDKVSNLEERFNNGTIILSFEITTFLKNWLLEHILGTDMKYSNFLIQKNVNV